MVFSDKTLQEISAKTPINDFELLNISGIGENKLSKYGPSVLSITKNFEKPEDEETFTFTKGEKQTVKSNRVPKVRAEKGIASTYMETYLLIQEGKTPEEISELKAVNINTIYNHLAYLHSKGKEVDLNKYITEDEVDKVKEAVLKTKEKEKVKILYEFMNEEIPYYKIRLAITLLEKS